MNQACEFPHSRQGIQPPQIRIIISFSLSRSLQVHQWEGRSFKKKKKKSKFFWQSKLHLTFILSVSLTFSVYFHSVKDNWIKINQAFYKNQSLQRKFSPPLQGMSHFKEARCETCFPWLPVLHIVLEIFLIQALN